MGSQRSINPPESLWYDPVSPCLMFSLSMTTIQKCYILLERGTASRWSFTSSNVPETAIFDITNWKMMNSGLSQSTSHLTLNVALLLCPSELYLYYPNCHRWQKKIHENEVMRAYKTVRDVLIEPVSFIVPRRVTIFSDVIIADIFSPRLFNPIYIQTH